MRTTGTGSAARRTRSSTPASVMPCAKATSLERWMVGPSARGSENGTPTSTRSAPAAATRCRASSDAAAVGNRAVRYGISAARPASRTVRHRAAMGRSDKVVADLEAVFDRVGDLDDGAREVALLIALREIGQEAGSEQRAVGGGHDAHYRAVHLADVGIGGVDDRHLIRVENDARPHGGDADQINERLQPHP